MKILLPDAASIPRGTLRYLQQVHMYCNSNMSFNSAKYTQTIHSSLTNCFDLHNYGQFQFQFIYLAK